MDGFHHWPNPVIFLAMMRWKIRDFKKTEPGRNIKNWRYAIHPIFYDMIWL